MTNSNFLDKDIEPVAIIDATQLHSPIPLLRLKKEIAAVKSGDVIQVNCTDIATENDMVSWSKKMKNIYLGTKKEAGYSCHFFKKK